MRSGVCCHLFACATPFANQLIDAIYGQVQQPESGKGQPPTSCSLSFKKHVLSEESYEISSESRKAFIL
jgi:hypothetical protein